MRRIVLLAGLLGLAACSKASTIDGGPGGGDAGNVESSAVLPDAGGTVNLDDLRFAPELGKVLAPAGLSLYLVDPRSHDATALTGFGQPDAGPSTSDASLVGRPGTSSADEGRGLIFANDRRYQLLYVVDPAARAIVATATLAGQPDYVRFVAETQEVWVTEPRNEQLEVLRLSSGTQPVPSHAALIPTPGGPEGLVIDHARGVAYTHAGNSQAITLTVQLSGRAVLATWPNGCGTGKGLALDAARGLLMVGCDEGKATVLDVKSGGQLLGSIQTNTGVDLIDYNPTLRHLYVPSAHAAKLSILGVSAQGMLSLLGEFDTASDGHSVAADDQGNAYVANGMGARLIVVKDPYPASE